MAASRMNFGARSLCAAIFFAGLGGSFVCSAPTTEHEMHFQQPFNAFNSEDFDEYAALTSPKRMLAVELDTHQCLQPGSMIRSGLSADLRSPLWIFVAGGASLLIGYVFYGRFISGMLSIDDSEATPADTHADGVDFVGMPDANVFLIQLLNIAGLGPIFGPLLGAMYGPAAFIWIIVGCIFFGSVADYMVGMMSVLSQGANMPVLMGRELGNCAKHLLNVVTLALLVLVGVVFVKGPATLLGDLTFGGSYAAEIWTGIIFGYYVIATIVPVNVVIGRIYPIFGAALVFMTVGLLGGTLLSGRPFPSLHSTAPDGDSWYPAVFIIISCSALSGFHSTQTPMMARCIKKQSSGYPIFFGAMIAEGFIGLIWAMSPLVFYGGQEGLAKALKCAHNNPANIVTKILTDLLGPIGGAVAIVGVVILPVTSGDTAFRSARLILAEMLGAQNGQKTMTRRLLISIPMFAIAFLVSLVDFKMVWQYFNFTNQLVAALTLWTAAAFLRRTGRWSIVASLPGAFMTICLTTYICKSPEFATADVPLWVAISIGGVLGAIAVTFMVVLIYRCPVTKSHGIEDKRKQTEENLQKMTRLQSLAEEGSTTNSDGCGEFFSSYASSDDLYALPPAPPPPPAAPCIQHCLAPIQAPQKVSI
mmetsp:Transcript_5149/g.11131  ORF Transcript_5149/g.11131 Transcript_5149/m.11131 type:complete len:646 (+) Transcript_5149:363-2300(+)